MSSDDATLILSQIERETMGKIAPRTVDDGGPAFPLSVAVGPSDDTYCSADVSGGMGMSLRDWFAGHAITAVYSETTPGAIATAAYRIADAMLTERRKS